MSKDLQFWVIQFLILLAVFGLILFISASIWKWSKSSLDSPTELKADALIIYQENSLASNSQFREEIVYAKVSAYNSTPEQTDSTPFITANGERVERGGIACPTYLEFGTLVLIDEELYNCNDRTHPKNDGTFDMWMETRIEAVTWGVPIKQITLLIF